MTLSSKQRTNLSKEISYILRHGAIQENITIDQDGWIHVDSLLQHLNRNEDKRQTTLADLQDVINLCPKKRHELDPDLTQIRARQGHTIQDVKDDNLLSPLTEEEIEAHPFAYHLTTEDNWEKICKTKALCKMERNHIHMQWEKPDMDCWGGIRPNLPVKIKIDLEKSYKQNGCNFVISGNKVLLCREDIPTGNLQRIQ